MQYTPPKVVDAPVGQSVDNPYPGIQNALNELLCLPLEGATGPFVAVHVQLGHKGRMLVDETIAAYQDAAKLALTTIKHNWHGLPTRVTSYRLFKESITVVHNVVISSSTIIREALTMENILKFSVPGKRKVFGNEYQELYRKMAKIRKRVEVLLLAEEAAGPAAITAPVPAASIAHQ